MPPLTLSDVGEMTGPDRPGALALSCARSRHQFQLRETGRRVDILVFMTVHNTRYIYVIVLMIVPAPALAVNV